MIQFAEKKHMPQVIEIWQECFKDSREEVEDFFSLCSNSVRICVKLEDGKVAGFLCLLSATLILAEVSAGKGKGTDNQVRENPTEYIYAVATKKEFRNKGICTSLLGYVRAILEKENKCGILVPADENLEQFYRKRCFSCCRDKKKKKH